MMKKSLAAAVAAELAFLSFSLAAPTAHAQAPVALEEVTVVARRRAENLQNVPVAMAVFSEQAIQDAGIERPGDFVLLTPNVVMIDSANAGDTQVSIRGQNSTRDAEPNFAFVVDGVLITNPNGFNGELFDIEQIEVLKGPQGALYGRNAVSGAIIVNSKKPTNEFEARVKAGVGVDNLRKGQVMIGGPIIQDQLFGRFALNYRETDGQFTNELSGRDDVVNFHEEYNARGRLVWEPNDRLSVDTQVSYRDVKGGAINFNAVLALPVAAQFTGVQELYKDVNDHQFRYVFNTPGYNDQENIFASVKTDYDLGSMTFTAIAAYDKLEESLGSDGTAAAFGGYSFGGPESAAACLNSYNSFDAGLLSPPFYAVRDGQPPGAFNADIGSLNGFLPPYSPTTCDGTQYQERNQDSRSLELRLASNGDGDFNWVMGGYYLKIDREVVVSYGADLGLGVIRAPYSAPGSINPTDVLFWDDFGTDVYSLFGQMEWSLADRHEVSLAARWDREERSVANQVPNVNAAQLFGAFGPRPINPAFDGSGTDVIEDRSRNFQHFQPKLSYTYAMTDEVSVYSSFGVGFRSGGFNSQGSEALIQQNYGTFDTAPQNIRDDFDKEVTEALEIGFKSRFLDNRLQVNGAAFRTKVKDYQSFTFFAGSFGLLRVVNNIDQVRINGAEMDFRFALNEYVTLNGGIGYLDSEIKKNANRPYTVGNDAPMAPGTTGTLGIDFRAPVYGDIELGVRLDLQHVGATWFSDVQKNTVTNAFTDLSEVYGIPGFGFGPAEFSRSRRDSFETANLRVSLAGGDRWTVTAWSTNITDKKFLEEVITAPEFGGTFVHENPGRLFGMDVIYNF